MRGINLGINIGSPSRISTGNIIQNGDLESGQITTSVFSPSTNNSGVYIDTAGISATVSSANPYRGTYHGRITFTVAASFGAVLLKQRYNQNAYQVTPGSKVILSAFISTNNIAAGRPITFGIRFFDNGGTPVGNVTVASISGTTAYALYQDIIKVPATAQNCDIIFYNDYNNTADRNIGSYCDFDLVQLTVDNNLVPNGDFEDAPTFIAPQTVSGRFIDGTATGSLVGPQKGWSASGLNSFAFRFDSGNGYGGSTNALKISTTGTGSFAEGFTPTNTDGTAGYFAKTKIAVLPNTTYRYSFRMKTNYVSGDSAGGAGMGIIESTKSGATAGAQVSTLQVKTTTAYTMYSGVFTTTSLTTFLQMTPLVYGHTGVATLIMDAWFDNIVIVPEMANLYGPNLVANAGFEDGLTGYSAYVNGGTAILPTIEIDTSVSYSGSRSVKITPSGTYAGSGIQINVSGLTVGKTYRTKAWVKGTAGQNFNIYPSNGPGKGWSHDGDWMETSVEWVASAGGAIQYFRTSSHSPSYPFWVDHIEVEQLL